MSLERLLADKPQLHNWSDGRATSWAVSPQVLSYINSCLRPGMRTLETGSGHTTIVFALAGANHTCVTPSRQEPERILEYCSRLGSSPSIRFITKSSDVALSEPEAVPDELDFVFIDGAHRFPFPCIDFHFTEGKLKVGGILGIDDCAMPSVRILHDFLCGEDEWERIKEIDDTVFFRRCRETQLVSDWQGQKINQVFKDGAKSLPRRGLWSRLRSKLFG